MHFRVKKEEHGFTIQEFAHENFQGAVARVWAYSTLPEMLEGLKLLYSSQPIPKKTGG